jgi:hypothetical protein
MYYSIVYYSSSIHRPLCQAKLSYIYLVVTQQIVQQPFTLTRFLVMLQAEVSTYLLENFQLKLNKLSQKDICLMCVFFWHTYLHLDQLPLTIRMYTKFPLATSFFVYQTYICFGLFVPHHL